MRASEFEAEGLSFYADELRRGSSDPYVAYCVFERFFMVRGNDTRKILRRATIRLIETDPWFLAAATSSFLHALETEDLDRLTPFVGAGPARKAASFLRAVLWFNARRGHHHPDRVGLAQLRRALEFLHLVPRAQRSLAWHEMFVGCYRALDYQRYKRAFAKLHELTEPQDRAFGLNEFLGVVGSRKDWRTYDRYRLEWDRLPAGHSACECYTNSVHTLDGLRAAAAGNWQAIPAALEKAAAVRGCPHLSTGGLRLDLAGLLVTRRKHLDAVRMYLDRAAAFDESGKELAALRRQLKSAEKAA